MSGRSGCGRRNALRAFLSAAAGASLGPGCEPRPEPPPRQISFPLAQLPVGSRKVLVFQGEPAEVHRTEKGLVARFLSCTHFGCSVTWKGAENLYACACHGGRFDASGRPVAGPPTLALRKIQVAVEGELVRLGEA